MTREVGYAIGFLRGKAQKTSKGRTMDQANAAVAGRELHGIDIPAPLGDGFRHRLSRKPA